MRGHRLIKAPEELQALVCSKSMPTLTWINIGTKFEGPFVKIPEWRHEFYPTAVASGKQLRRGLARTKV